MSDEIFPPRRIDMATREGASLTKRLQEFFEELTTFVNAIEVEAGEIGVTQEDLDNALLFLSGMQVQPRLNSLLGQLVETNERLDTVEQQAATQRAQINSLLAQVDEMEMELNDKINASDLASLRYLIANTKTEMRSFFEQNVNLMPRFYN